MPPQTLVTTVRPAVMKWARESAGVSAEDAAKRLGLTVAAVEKWEAGKGNPTLRTLETLSVYYKRPLAAFFLAEPPKGPSLPEDFRVLPGSTPRHLSRDALLAIREARRVQALVTDLNEQLGLPKLSEAGRAAAIAHPGTAAARTRKDLGVTVHQQFGWRDSRVALREWRRTVESTDILVMQIGMPMDQARGFALAGPGFPAIVVNSRDAINGRIFTLFHEYAHLLVGSSAICMPDQLWDAHGNTGKDERFCNAFAAALLVPEKALLDTEEVHAIIRSRPLPDELLHKIAARFKVSTAVILHRLRAAKVISNAQCNRKLRQLDSLPSHIKKQGRSFGLPPARRCLQQKGPLFVQRVLEAKAQGLITYRDVADYLSIRLKYLDQVESLISERGTNG